MAWAPSRPGHRQGVNGMPPGRKANGRVVIKLSEPRRECGPPGEQGRPDNTTLQSERGSREEGIDKKSTSGGRV